MDFERFDRRLADLRTRVKDFQAEPIGSDGGARELIDDLMKALDSARARLCEAEERIDLAAMASREERQRLQEFFDDAPIASLVTDVNGVVERANRAAADLLGPVAGTLVGRPLQGLIPDAGIDAALEGFRGGMATPEVQVQLPGGRESRGGLATVIIAILSDFDGNPARLIWLIRPFAAGPIDGSNSEPVAVCSALFGPESEAASDGVHRSAVSDLNRARAGDGFPDLLDDIGAIVWEATPDGEILAVSGHLNRLFGQAPGAATRLAEDYDRLIHPADVSYVMACRGRCADEASEVELDYRLVAPGGRTIGVAETIRPRLDGAGRVASICGVVSVMRSREGGQGQSERHRRELATMGRVLALLGRKGRRSTPDQALGDILDCMLELTNQTVGMVRLYDGTRKRLEIVASRGAAPAGVRSPEPGRRRANLDTTAVGPGRAGFLPDPCRTIPWPQGEPVSYRSLALRGRDGGLLGSIDIACSRPVRLAAGKARLIRSIARIAAEMLQAGRPARRLPGRTRSDHLGMAAMAHELRTPLAVILNSVHHLRRVADGVPASAAICERIDRQARAVSQLVDEVYDHCRIEQTGLALEVAPIDVADVVAGACDSIRPIADAKRQSLSIVMPAGPLRVEVDRRRIGQLLGVLLSNAVRHSPPGGAIKLLVRREGRSIVFRVRDSGVSLASVPAGRAFEPFVRAGRDGVWSPEGIGLGLWLVKAIAEAHGGEASCRSRGLDRGSEFCVKLPTFQVEATGAGA